MNKKAQSQIITTVLIILLVLAAIVIVWQVVNNTIKGGTEEIDKQSTCLGISMEVTASGANNVTVKRIGGNTLTGTKVVITDDGNSVTDPTAAPYSIPDGTFNEPMASKKMTGLTPGHEIEVALKLSDGTVCPISGKATVPS